MVPKLRIALDYDGTYSADPEMWEHFIDLVHTFGHEIFVVTMRYPEEAIWHKTPCPVFYTSRQGKKRYMENLGYTFDIWIDDNPHWVLESTNEAKWPEEKSRLYQCDSVECKYPKRSVDHTHCPVCARKD